MNNGIFITQNLVFNFFSFTFLVLLENLRWEIRAENTVVTKEGQYRYIQFFQDEVVDALSIKKGSTSLLPGIMKSFFLWNEFELKLSRLSYSRVAIK